jgi:hypothetical protein
MKYWIYSRRKCMGKRKNMLFLMSVCFVFCVLGFVSFGRIAFLDHKRQIWLLKETVNARNDNNNYGFDLTEEDAEFLQKHIFGEWKFVKQLKDELGLESEVKHWNTDEMSDITVLLDESAVRLNGYSEQTFSEAEDAFVFTQFKESMEVKMPVYHIYKEEDAEKMEACIYLMKVLEERSGNVNRQSEKSRMMAAWFDLGYDRYRNPSVSIWYDARRIYVNLEDIDTIYLDFCGLWELERVNSD